MSVGAKGPTLLVKSHMVNETKKLFENDARLKDSGCTLNVSDEIDFLGISAYIHRDGRIFATFKKKSLQDLIFFKHELAKSSRLMLNQRNIDYAKITATLSQAVSAHIESRIMSILPFADVQTVFTVYNMHRKAVCSILNSNMSAFGFKPKLFTKHKPIDNLYVFIKDLMSKSYIKICLISGKPNILQIAARAAKVVIDQSSDTIDEFNRESGRFRPRQLPLIKKKIC